MLSLSIVFWLTVAAALIAFWWQSDKVKILALSLAQQHCDKQGLQFLDQSMVLRGVWPQRDNTGSLRLRRRYQFEFSSTGEARYLGVVIMVGLRLKSMELEAHIIPNDDPPLH